MPIIARPPSSMRLFAHPAETSKRPWLGTLEFFLATPLAGFGAYWAAKFAEVAFTHPKDPHALGGLGVALFFFAMATYYGALAGRAVLDMAKIKA